MAVPRLAFDQQLGTTAGVHGNTDSLPSPVPLLTPSYGRWVFRWTQGTRRPICTSFNIKNKKLLGEEHSSTCKSTCHMSLAPKSAPEQTMTNVTPSAVSTAQTGHKRVSRKHLGHTAWNTQPSNRNQRDTTSARRKARTIARSCPLSSTRTLGGIHVYSTWSFQDHAKSLLC